jgi:hypothetical protein
MKDFKYIGILLIILLVGCKEEQEIANHSLVSGYTFEVSDTLLNASAHSFMLYPKPIGDSPGSTNNWIFYGLCEWDETLPSDKWLSKYIYTDKNIDPSTVISWLKLEKKIVDNKPMISFEVQKNNTGEYRAARVEIGEFYHGMVLYGVVRIAQNGDQYEK